MDDHLLATPDQVEVKEGYKKLDYMIMITCEDDVYNCIKSIQEKTKKGTFIY